MIIAVAGGTGSGKSYLARNLSNTYTKEELLIIEQDSYYKDISNLDYEDRCKQNFDHPDAIDSILIENHLKKILSGKTIYSPRYNFFKHLREKEKKKIKQRPIIIMEGILLLHYIRLHKFYTLKVFVETPEHIRINNLIEHFKNHKHDNHSKRGLVALVNNRKKLLSYLSKKDNEKYMKLIKELNIRG